MESSIFRSTTIRGKGCDYFRGSVRLVIWHSSHRNGRKRKFAVGYHSVNEAALELALFRAVVDCGYGCHWRHTKERIISPTRMLETDFIDPSFRTEFFDKFRERVVRAGCLEEAITLSIVQHPALKAALASSSTLSNSSCTAIRSDSEASQVDVSGEGGASEPVLLPSFIGQGFQKESEVTAAKKATSIHDSTSRSGNDNNNNNNQLVQKENTNTSLCKPPEAHDKPPQLRGRILFDDHESTVPSATATSTNASNDDRDSDSANMLKGLFAFQQVRDMPNVAAAKSIIPVESVEEATLQASLLSYTGGKAVAAPPSSAKMKQSKRQSEDSAVPLCRKKRSDSDIAPKVQQDKLVRTVADWAKRANELLDSVAVSQTRAKWLRHKALSDPAGLIIEHPITRDDGEVVDIEDKTLSQRLIKSDGHHFSVSDVTRGAQQAIAVAEFESALADREVHQRNLLMKAMPSAMLVNSTDLINRTGGSAKKRRKDGARNPLKVGCSAFDLEDPEDELSKRKLWTSETDVRRVLVPNTMTEMQVLQLLEQFQSVRGENDHYRRNVASKPQLAEGVTAGFAKLSPRTLRSWHSEFLHNNCRGFFEDMRGKQPRELLVDALNLGPGLNAFMRSRLRKKECLSVDVGCNFLNAQILSLLQEEEKEDDGREVSTPEKNKDITSDGAGSVAQGGAEKKKLSVADILLQHRAAYPISRSTAYRCMLQRGAKWESFKHSYYNDKHQAKATLQYRNDIYLPAMFANMQRAPVWVTVPRQLATDNAIADAKAILWNIAEQHDVPTFDGVENNFVAASSTSVGQQQQQLQQPTNLLIECCQIHVDFLSPKDFDTFRTAQFEATGYSGEFHRNFARPVGPRQWDFLRRPLAEALPGHEHESCRVGHSAETCKCHLPLELAGQDETCFYAHSLSSKCWVIDGVQQPRKKDEGVGSMLSAIILPDKGFGVPLTDAEALQLNAAGHHNAYEFKDQPDRLWKGGDYLGLQFFDFGAKRDGYWNCDKMAKQLEHFIKGYDILFPSNQLMMQLDHSSGHTKYSDDALAVSHMNMKYGGKQRVPRDSVLSAECLGPTTVYTSQTANGTMLTYHRLSIGDTQSFVFKEGDLPPFDSPNAPKYDIPMTTQQKNKLIVKLNAERAKKKKPFLSQKEIDETNTPAVVGYIGKPKGVRHILVERGLWVSGMRSALSNKDVEQGKILEAARDAHLALNKCPDFKLEKPAIQMLLEQYGHLLLLSPKCHPELAGEGVEYCIGNVKMFYRRLFNTTVADELKVNVLKAVSTVNAGKITIWHYARRCRGYMRLYREQNLQLVKRDTNGNITDDCLHQLPQYDELERMMKRKSTHRNMEELERYYIQRTAFDHGQVLPKDMESKMNASTKLAASKAKAVSGISAAPCTNVEGESNTAQEQQPQEVQKRSSSKRNRGNTISSRTNKKSRSTNGQSGVSLKRSRDGGDLDAMMDTMRSSTTEQQRNKQQRSLEGDKP